MTITLSIPAVVTSRALAVALDRALPPGTCLRRDLARALGVANSRISVAVDHRYRDTDHRARVAAAAGYERHPTMPGYYRRVRPNPLEA